jgi:hypothetical protein
MVMPPAVSAGASLGPVSVVITAPAAMIGRAGVRRARAVGPDRAHRDGLR